MILYAATSNPGKLAEFTTTAATSGVEVLALPGLADMPEPVEDAATFRGNAEIKALAYSRLAPGLLVMADDSGLEVEALGGQPGVRSARFADDMGFELPPTSVISTGGAPLRRSGETPAFAPAQSRAATRDLRNNRCVLSLLAALPNPTRAARFTCELAVARDGRILYNARGKVEGVLLTAPRGTDGFGYDPLFLVPALGLTFAEIPREQKWQLSHRGNAFRALLTQLHNRSL
jgi:XTP/dITP diphosphohydrolase